MVNVLALGNAIVDIQLQVSEEEFTKTGLTKSTMNLVNPDQQQSLLQSLSSHQPNRASGGSAANTIIALSELGSKASFCSCVGGDELGRFYTGELKEMGISCFVGSRETLSTGTSVILITPDTERTMNTSLGASATFSENDINPEMFAGAEWLYIEGYLLSVDQSYKACLKACELAKQNGLKIALTLSDVFIAQIFHDQTKSVLEHCHLVFANINEAMAYTQCSNEEEAIKEMSTICSMAAITMSEKGSYVIENGQTSFVEPVPVKAVDATGAGDAYAGGVLHGICSGKSLTESASLGSLIASKVVGQLGPRLTKDQVEEIIKNSM